MPQHYYHRQPAPRQRPSSHPHRQAHTSAYLPPRALNEAQVQPMYPGVEPYYPPFQEVEASGLVPYSPGGPGGPGGNFFGGGAPVAPPVPVETPAASSGFSLANIGELKGMIDRFGGIDGIMNGIGKMQKVVGGFQQMAPMMKLVMGILPFGKGKKSSSAADQDYEEYSPPRSRKRRKKTTATPRKRNTNNKTGRNKSNSTRRRPKRNKKL
ncbi:tyrosine protein kinase [Paenibacillus pabuli]|uniref:tyrosine protein kinase n=1 Tax=Paenibacillus pabuli TaxID=1472 RepID=UPI001FFF977E|nr:tyrosine protein kinase [Paenibacillus pabuli]UPK44711.1 tyrosine protein kinase [Paenibacillus pabuli]